MKNEPDISVIVPIYNVEEYLAECLDSLNNQTKKDIEVIMVDDDSQDSSGEIAKAYAQEHPNFHYYHKELPLLLRDKCQYYHYIRKFEFYRFPLQAQMNHPR